MRAASSADAEQRVQRALDLLDELLEFEGKLAVLEHTFLEDHLLIWPLVRFRLFDDALSQVLQIPTFKTPVARRSLVRDLRYAREVLRGDPLRMTGTFDVLVFGSTVGVSVQRGQRWFGRINDYFALEYDARTLVLDESLQREFRRPRLPQHVAAHDALPLRAALRATFTRRAADAADERAIDRFVRFIAQAMPGPAAATTLARVAQALRFHVHHAPFLREGYLRLFERTRPKCLFLEDASFGTQAHILKWARDAGIRTVEFQHGVIGPTHVAYKYATTLLASAAFRPYLPEFLLTYGRFFSENVRTASTLVSVGNPHFEQKQRELSQRVSPLGAGARPRIVIVSQTDAAPELVPLALELARRLRDRADVIYRVHPSEQCNGGLYAPLRGIENISISQGGDIYELLHGATAVVGVASTVLFEAAGLGRRVFILATPSARFFVPSSFGHWVADAEELARIVLDAGQSAALDTAYYFERDAQARFRAFMAGSVGLC